MAIAGVALLSACSSTKNVIKSPIDTRQPRELKEIAQNVGKLSNKEAKSLLSGVADSYTDWNELSMEGKLSMKGLPIDPSFKVWMRKGSDVIVSLRAPIIGEVGRVEISPDSITVVNRMDKVYTRASSSEAFGKVGMSVLDVQDLLIGRIFYAGSGTLSSGNLSSMEVCANPGGGWIVTPKKQHSLAQYGFTLAADLLLQIAFATSYDDLYQATVEYTRSSPTAEEKDVKIQVTAVDKIFTALLSCDAPNFSNPKAIEPVKINKNWKRRSFKELLSSLK